MIHTGILGGDFIIGDYVLENTSTYWEEYILKFRNQTINPSTNQDELFDFQDNSILISPNPSTSKIQVNVKNLEIENIKLVHINGQLLWQDQQEFKNSRELDFSFLSNGLYILQFKTKEGTISKKMIIAK